MKFEDIVRILVDIPYMQPNDGKVIYELVLNSEIKNILELGFAHGTSTCYMAAALHEKSAGLITTIDTKDSKNLQPNIFVLLNKTKLGDYVNPIFANTSYNWELMKLIKEQSDGEECKPIFDFCYIDGAHSWETDGFAFFLVEKLLKHGGWILFDDLYWTYDTSASLKKTKWVKNMPVDEKSTPQVERIFSLLVSQQKNFENFKIHGNGGWAKKKNLEAETLNIPEKLIDEILSSKTSDILPLNKRDISKLNVKKLIQKVLMLFKINK